MNNDIENLKKRLIYRSQYRGTKEMDLFVNKFVNSVIQNLDFSQLIELDELINLNDEELIKISNQEIDENENKVLTLLKEFKKNY